MATISPTIRKDRVSEDGTATLLIAVRHHQKTAYITTDIKVTAKDFTGGMVVRGTNAKATNGKIMSLLNQYQERLDEMPNVDAKDVIQVKEYLQQDRIQKYHKITECYDSYIRTLKAANSILSYQHGYSVIYEYCKHRNINIESIDATWVENYATWLETTDVISSKKRNRIKKYAPSTISTMLSQLRAVINWCIKNEWVTYKSHPFIRTTIHQKTIRENHISPEDFKKIRDYTPDRYTQRAYDMFILSFELAGANLADMVHFDFRKDKITFVRQKIKDRTNGKVKVTIPILPSVRQRVQPYLNKDGMIDLGCSVNYRYVEINKYIKRIAEEAGVSNWQDITFTSARKAFATIGTNLGFSDNYLNYLLGHSMAKARGMMNPYSNTDAELAAEILRTIVYMSDHPEQIRQRFMENIQKLKETVQQ